MWSVHHYLLLIYGFTRCVSFNLSGRLLDTLRCPRVVYLKRYFAPRQYEEGLGTGHQTQHRLEGMRHDFTVRRAKKNGGPLSLLKDLFFLHIETATGQRQAEVLKPVFCSFILRNS